jgi:hypothetical protein
VTIDDLSATELHAIATRALAHGDACGRQLLREQLEAEEFADESPFEETKVKFTEELDKARGRSPAAFIGTLKMYCEDGSCAAREVTIGVKELPGEKKIAGAPKCPICGRELNTHAVVNAVDEKG